MSRLVGLISLGALLASCCPPMPATATTPIAVVPQPSPGEPVKPPPPPEPEKPLTQTALPQELTFVDEPFRASQPAAAAPRPFQLPAVKQFKLKSGVQVYLVEQHTLPVVALDLNFDGGSITDPAGKEGLASVCMAMVSEGTQALDKIAFSEALADVASTVDSYAGDDTQGVSMRTLTKHLDTTFALFVDTLLKPGFRADDLDRMIKRRLEGLKQAKAAPASIAGRVASPVLFGATHPLGKVTTEPSLGAITLDDCKAYHARALKPQGARLFVVGDLTEAQIRERFDGPLLASWKGKAPRLARPAKPTTMKGRIFFVDVPGAAQSQVQLMHFGPLRTAPDYMATTLMSSILGGGFSSRLNMNLREDKGYSYGARGGFGYTRFFGTFGAGASVRTDSTYQTVLEIVHEVSALATAKTPPTAAELDREKTGAILGLPGRFATSSAALQAFRGLVYFGLPLDYYASYVARMGKVDAAQVAKAAKAHLKPGDAVFLVVGDGSAPVKVRNGKADEPLLKDGQPVTLRQALTDLAATGELGKGALVVLDADGKPLP